MLVLGISDFTRKNIHPFLFVPDVYNSESRTAASGSIVKKEF